jgi:hypothetical protein
MDAQSVAEMLTTTLFPAPIYRSYGELIVNDQHVFGSSSMPAKDIGLFMAEVRKSKLPVAISQALLALLERP